MFLVAIHVGVSPSGVTPGEDDAEAAGASDDGGVANGVGLVADVQATPRSVTTIVIATRSSEGRISCPPDGV